MNTQNDIYSRLLKLYPVDILKEYFSITGRKEDVIQGIITGNSVNNIHTFCATHIPITKQHIFIYSHSNPNFSRLQRTVFSLPATVINETNSTLKKTFSLLFDLEYVLSVTGQTNQVPIIYKWPVQVSITSTHVIIHITVLERNPATELEDNVRGFIESKSLEEIDIIRIISTALNGFSTIRNCDINNGVKHLWDIDVIDAKTTKFKTDNSLSSETMDENYTVKAHKREVYNNLILAPLRVTSFVFMNDINNRFTKHITIDPTEGQIKVTIYPDDISQIDNIIESIIQNN
jgi:hypothetical protein